MAVQVISGPTTLPLGVAGLQNYATDSGAVAAVINTEMVKKSFPSTVAYLLPRGDSTLYTLTSKAKEETALQIEHGFNAKVMVFPQFTLSASALIGATSLTVYDANQVIPNGLYKLVGISTGGGATLTPRVTYASEVVLVTGVSGNTLTVSRGVGSTAAALLEDSTFVHIGNAFGDASLRPNSFLTKAVRIINYTQTLRNTWAISGTTAAIQMAIGDDNVASSRRECMQYHAMDIEKSITFGQRSISVGVQGTSNSFRTMNGVVPQIFDTQGSDLFLPGTSGASNIVTANSLVNGSAVAGAISIVDFENAMDNTFNMSYSPESGMERLLLVGAGAHKVLNRLFRYNINYQMLNGTTEWGLSFMTVQLSRGRIAMVEHPYMNTNLFMSRMAIILDVPSLSLAYMTGRKTRAEEFGNGMLMVDNAIDAAGGSLLTELTIMCKNPSGCGVLMNLQKSVKPDGLTAE